MIKIYKAQICKFDKINQGDFTCKLMIDEKSLKTINGIKIKENIVDIYTGESYHILKRNKTGIYIDKTETIEQNKYYVRKIEETSLIDRLKILKDVLCENSIKKGNQKTKTY